MTDARPARSVRVRMRTAVLLAGVALAAAGCGGGRRRCAPAKGARLAEPITFEVIGGDAFRDDEMTVAADGSARVETRDGERATELTDDELAALAETVRTTDLAAVESALTDPPQPDALSYRFTYRGTQVETDSGAMPRDLEPLIAKFIDLIDEHGPQ